MTCHRNDAGLAIWLFHQLWFGMEHHEGVSISAPPDNEACFSGPRLRESSPSHQLGSEASGRRRIK